MSSDAARASGDPLARILPVLVTPRTAGNVGACARAVKNMGLGGLALVEPVPWRDPEEFLAEARRLAVEADDILSRMQIASDLDELIGPSTYLVATSARARRALTPLSPREAAPRLVDLARKRPVAILFGREDHGLPERLLGRASLLLQVPASAAYPVLNLAQSVMLIAYELRLAAAATAEPASAACDEEPVAPAELDALHRDAVELLTRADFLKAHNRQRVIAELAELAARARPSAREVSMLRGICRQVRWLLSTAAPPD